METEHSYTADSSSTSESTAGTSEPEDERLEPVNILGHSLELPQDLCENYSIFKEFFSMKTWESLDERHKEHLRTFLPTFSENDAEEKDKTIRMLFSRETFHFTSPLKDFFNNLKMGSYRPDITKMKKFLLKARSKQQKHKMRSYYAKLLPEVLISRERLLAAAKAAPPGSPPRVSPLPPKPSTKNNYKSPYIRARQRYFEELTAIRSEVGGDESEDENYPEGPPIQSTLHNPNKELQGADSNVAGTLGAMDTTQQTSLDCLKTVLAAHRARRNYKEIHPELNTSGITLEDIKQRVSLVNGTKKMVFGVQKSSETAIQKLKRAHKRDNVFAKIPKLSADVKSPMKTGKIKDEQHDSLDNVPLLPNLKIKCEEPESDSESSNFVEPVTSPKIGKKFKGSPENNEMKADAKFSTKADSMEFLQSKLEPTVKQEPCDTITNILNPNARVPIKLEDLEGIDMMALPVELADDCPDLIESARHMDDELSLTTAEADESLMETTHANFLSLVRALFPARTAHRASRQELHARCVALMRSPIAPLNTWYSLSDDWCAELDSALEFLAGEKGPHPDDFVPYLQFMPDTQVQDRIGRGTSPKADGTSSRKHERLHLVKGNRMYQWIGAGRDCDAILGRLCERWLRARCAPIEPPSPPSGPCHTTDVLPPRYPTTWVIRLASNAELAEFRAQERRRFASASKPFTYVQHGYRSVVGPCARSPLACGAHSSLLLSERPRHATFMALVRDAVARLPNGEGTRRDIVSLIRMSQWLRPCSEQTLSSAASSVLDRLHAAKRDPVVRYDQRMATWIYLHRHKSEEDWVKSTGSRSRVRPVPVAVSSQDLATPPPAMEIEVGSTTEILENDSDTDVDVDDSDLSSASPHITSAQMLLQASQSKQKLLRAKQSVQQTQKQLIQQPKQPAKPIKHLVQLTPKLPNQQIKPKAVVNQTVKVIKPQVENSNLAEPVHPPKSSPATVVLPQKSPLMKQKLIQRADVSQALTSTHATPSLHAPQTTASSIQQNISKITQATRSLLLRPPSVQTTVTASASVAFATTTQVIAGGRRSVVRVLSPATPSSGKSLISPRALQQGNQTPTKQHQRRTTAQTTSSVTTVAQSTPSVASVVSSAATAVTTSVTTRTVQLPGGRTVQIAGNQTVHLPGGQAVQLASGHTLQLSSLQLPTHSVRLPSGQTVQLASPQTVQTVRTVTATGIKTQNPQVQKPALPAIRANIQTSTQPTTVQIPNVLAGQTVQIAGQNLQLTGHTVKLPSGQTVQVAGPNIQLPSGQSVQLSSAVQLAGQNVQLPSGQTVQLGTQVQLPSGQTVQLASGQTVQLPSGQTLQLPSGQTVQLSSGQALQLPSGQTVQLPVQVSKSITQQIVRPAATTEKTTQPIVAKLLTNPQGHMISLEGVVGGARSLQLSAVRPQAPKTLQTVQGVSMASGGVRVVSAAGTRVARPLLLTSKPLHNIILQQQGEGGAIRVTSSAGVVSSQTLVLGNLGAQTVTTPASSTPVLKLQQVNPLQQVKLAQGIKIQQTGSASESSTAATTSITAGGVRGVLLDGQQLKLVGGRHVLARLLRPAQPQ